jgi:ribosomal protein L29
MFRPYRPLMAVTQRTQYLYGKTVVDIENEQLPFVTNGPADAAVKRTKANSHTELRQAEYYQELLEELRTELVLELAHLRASLAARQEEASVSGASRMKRVIAAKESELTEIDQLTAALHARFPTSPFHSDDPESLRRIAV